MKNSRMSKLARRRLKNPKAVRLAALKAYRTLSNAARQLVRAIIVDGLPVAQAITEHKNGGRMWNSRPVVDCLKAFGWQEPKPAEVPATYVPVVHPPIPELPCELCGTVGPHTSRHNSHLVCERCLCRESNIRSVAPPRPEKCWECGADAQPTWDGRWLCPTHFSVAASAQAQQSSAEFAAAVARRNVLANQGRDMNTCDLAAQRGMDTDNNYSRSVQIWQELDAEAADRQAQESRERARIEEELNRRRADYISRHGSLAPHDKF